jgi:hypothetical protein
MEFGEVEPPGRRRQKKNREEITTRDWGGPDAVIRHT